MTMRRGLKRKLWYLGAIGVLLLPIAWLSQPSTGSSPGGVLARERARLALSPADLGQIDPTGEALKLATLGMRGIAAQVLWWKAFEYQKEENFNELSAVNEQITKLMPNYISAWRFQCWNLSYNVSVEFDDYRDRYFWVIKGIKFLQQGIDYNRREPRLRWDEGWFICHKIGRSDERKLFRVMFRKDDDFFAGTDTPEALRDNWLVGKSRYQLAERLVDEEGAPLRGMNPVLFHSDPAMAQINYAQGLEEDGTFGERAAVAWTQAKQDWDEYGQREFAVRGGTIKLSEYELFKKLASEKLAALVALAPDAPRQIREARIDKLPPEKQALARKPTKEVTWAEAQERYEIDLAVVPTSSDMVAAVAPEYRPTAAQLAEVYEQYREQADAIDRFRNTVNFQYWQTRCDAEKTDEAISARRSIYTGDKLFAEADLQGAKREYEAGLAGWRGVLDKFPLLIRDGTTGDELVRTVKKYESILKQLDEPLPKPFILQDIMDLHAPKRPPVKGPENEAASDGQPERGEEKSPAPQSP